MSLYKVLVCFTLAQTVFAYYRHTNVTLLTGNNFHDLVTNENIWVVNFHTSKTKRCQDFVKEFALSADILKPLVKFGAVDIEDDAELAKKFNFDMQQLPAVKIYGISSDRNPKEYTGPKVTQDLVESVLKNIVKKIRKQFRNDLRDNSIKEVTDDDFDELITNSKEPWMVLFYAPWCFHCKELQPIWSLVASRLQGKIKCASMDATVNKMKAEEYKIQAYPTVKLFPYGKKSPKHALDYSQDRTVDSIVEWALEKLPAPSIVQLTSVDVFGRHCMKQAICVITALPSILDCQADCRKSYLKTLKHLAEKFKIRGWGWIWTEAHNQESLESALDIGGFGYPALVVLNPVKMKYSVFKGAFTKSNIDEFLTKLDRAAAVGVEENLMEKIVTVDAWDGKDLVNMYLHDKNEL